RRRRTWRRRSGAGLDNFAGGVPCDVHGVGDLQPGEDLARADAFAGEPSHGHGNPIADRHSDRNHHTDEHTTPNTNSDRDATPGGGWPKDNHSVPHADAFAVANWSTHSGHDPLVGFQTLG